MPGIPPTKFEKAKAHSQPLAAFRSAKEDSKWFEEVKGEGTKRSYSSALFRYWNEFLNRNIQVSRTEFKAVRTQRESKEPMIREQWISGLSAYSLGR